MNDCTTLCFVYWDGSQERFTRASMVHINGGNVDDTMINWRGLLSGMTDYKNVWIYYALNDFQCGYDGNGQNRCIEMLEKLMTLTDSSEQKLNLLQMSFYFSVGIGNQLSFALAASDDRQTCYWGEQAHEVERQRERQRKP